MAGKNVRSMSGKKGAGMSAPGRPKGMDMAKAMKKVEGSAADKRQDKAMAMKMMKKGKK